MIHRIEIAVRRDVPHVTDPRGLHAADQIRRFLHLPIDSVRTRDVYHVEAELSPEEVSRVVGELADPVLHAAAIGRLEDGGFDAAVTVGYKPGVADPVGRSARVAIEDTLGRSLGNGAAVYTSTVYLLEGTNQAAAERIAVELLANPVIQRIRVQSEEEWHGSEPDLSVPKVATSETPPAAQIDLGGSDEELLRISREGLLALSLDEMRAIRDHFRGAAGDSRRQACGLSGEPTDVELECLAQTWSEHCKHKIFNARITYRESADAEPETIESLFSSYIRRTTEEVRRQQEEREGKSWLVSVFHDNAGAVAFDDEIHLVYKVETHNSPSALDPYGGAITGIVGVNRDPFGTGRGSNLLVNVWGYCFASPFYDGELPPGLLHPHRIRDGVHWGVIDGGNQSGVPYGRGWELFDDRYLGKPLVFCGTVGSLPVTIDGTPGEEKEPRPGDAIVMVGGRIGADGIHGATFSSAALDESSPSQAVQIGDPLTQKMMFDCLLEARDAGLYSAITDNGAGGLSSSVGEMAEGPGGARLDLEKAPLKYAGLAPWEIFLSEAQERMTLAIPPEKVEAFLDLARRREVEATVLGEFTDDGYLHVTYGDETVALLSMEFLHEGDPQLQLEAVWTPPVFDEQSVGASREANSKPAAGSASGSNDSGDYGATLVEMVGRPNLASGEDKARHYDHEVKALAAVKPYIGVDADVPAEATVFLARHGSLRGFVLSEGVNPYLSDLDTFAMAETVVDEAVRRQLCAGARLDRIAALDNFCWPDPIRSASTPDGEYKLAQLVRACRGLYETCRAYGVPLISGKDSMKNEAVLGGVKICVPPTLLVSAIGQIDDVRDAVTLGFKAEGDAVFILGETGDHTGGSEYFRHLGERDGKHAAMAELGQPAPFIGNRPPTVDAQATWPLYEAFHAAIRSGIVRSAATPTKGGLAACLARSAMAGGLGCHVDLSGCAGMDDLADDRALFSESNGRFVVTVAAPDADRFEAFFGGLRSRAGRGLCHRAGMVTSDPRLRITCRGRTIADVGVEDLKKSFKEGLADA